MTTRTITVEALAAAQHIVGPYHVHHHIEGVPESCEEQASNLFAALPAEPADTTGSDWATAAAEVHRAFCDPEHELVGEWDREMAESLRRNGLRIVPAERKATMKRAKAAVDDLAGACHDGEGLGCDSYPCEVNVERAAVLAILDAEIQQAALVAAPVGEEHCPCPDHYSDFCFCNHHDHSPSGEDK